ncbi:hypothetical protein BJY04DRAFT_86489 [Aspergillus karnatakaensis]|uniref:uncharacterized protein n=1 Tax=Aspergillus karnatakaensis TaxID=1810916 RepID=UPI003CCE0EAC
MKLPKKRQPGQLSIHGFFGGTKPNSSAPAPIDDANNPSSSAFPVEKMSIGGDIGENEDEETGEDWEISLYIKEDIGEGEGIDNDEDDIEDEPEDIQFYHQRLDRTLKSIRAHKQTAHFKEFFQKTSNAEISDMMVRYTSPSVLQLLSRDNIPTFAEFAALPWNETANMGVYAKLAYEGSITNATDNAHFLYVGSATDRKGGLAKRRKDHLNPTGKAKDAYYMRIVHGPPVVRNQQMITLFQLDRQLDSSEEDIIRARTMCMLAEAVYTSWLGGYRSTAQWSLRAACPYGNPGDIFTWLGVCSHLAIHEGLRPRLNPSLDLDILDADINLSQEDVASLTNRSPKPATMVESDDARAARLEWHRQYYRSMIASMDAEQRASFREEKAEAKRIWLANNPDKRDQYNEKRRNDPVYGEKNRLYMRKRRASGWDETAGKSPEWHEQERERKRIDTRKRRERKRLANPKEKHVVPEENIARNAMQMANYKADPDAQFKGKLSMQVTRSANQFFKVYFNPEKKLADSDTELVRWVLDSVNRQEEFAEIVDSKITLPKCCFEIAEYADPPETRRRKSKKTLADEARKAEQMDENERQLRIHRAEALSIIVDIHRDMITDLICKQHDKAMETQRKKIEGA